MAFINPGIAILKTWQGIAEIALRVACAVLCFIVMICAAVALEAIGNVQDRFDLIDQDYENSNSYRSAAGWLVFVAVLGMFYEPFVIALRFLNVEIINQNFMIIGFVDVGVSIVFALSLFAGGAASAAYSSDNADTYKETYKRSCDSTRSADVEKFCSDFRRVRDSQGASAAFAFFAMIAFGALAGIMVLTILIGGRKAQSGGHSDPSEYKEDATQ